MIRYELCPACGSGQIAEVAVVRDFSVSQESFPVFHCSACTIRFTQNIPEQENIGRYYQSEAYISHTDTRKGLVNNLYHRVRKITLNSKRNLISRYTGKNSGNLLDYGCGTGAFLNEMKQNGWKANGLEPDPGARQKAKELYGLEISPADYLSAFPHGSEDVITLWHVIEHVHALHETMDHLFNVLKPGGTIFIAVPNYTSKDAAIYKEYWAAWDLPRHLYHFSPASMQRLLVSKGFQLKATLPMWFDSFYVSMLSEQYKNGKSNLAGAVISGLRSNLFALTHAGRCSSQIYVAQKPAGNYFF